MWQSHLLWKKFWYKGFQSEGRPRSYLPSISEGEHFRKGMLSSALEPEMPFSVLLVSGSLLSGISCRYAVNPLCCIKEGRKQKAWETTRFIRQAFMAGPDRLWTGSKAHSEED